MSRSTETTNLHGAYFTLSGMACFKDGVAIVPAAKTPVTFHSADTTVYSAELCQYQAGVFVSQPIDGGSTILSWKTLTFDFSKPSDTYVYVYARSFPSSNPSGEWIGPFVNGTEEDVSVLKDRYAQLKIVLVAEGTTAPTSPTVSKMSLEAYATGGEATFFTKYFDLGFKADHVLLTYNGTVGDDMLVEFGIWGKDEADFSRYQIVTPNKLTKLDDIPALSTGMKVGIRGIGSAQQSFIIDEFAVTLSSVDGTKLELNQ